VKLDQGLAAAFLGAPPQGKEEQRQEKALGQKEKQGLIHY